MDAVRFFDQYIKADMTILEFGSGASTLWLARRAAHVFSVEHSGPWFDSVERNIMKAAVNNVTLSYRSSSDYVDLENFRGKQFDVIIVDGILRWRCVQAAQGMLAPGGIIYLDNSDADKDRRSYSDATMSREAQRLLSSLGSQRGAKTHVFRSFPPGELYVTAGTAVQLAAAD